jgi:serine phosphatase RsbU (regulator of sigma subunit)
MNLRLKFALIMAIPLVFVYIAMNLMQFYELGRTTLNEERSNAETMVRLQAEEVSAYARFAELRANGILASIKTAERIDSDRIHMFLRAAATPTWVAGIGLMDTQSGDARTFFQIGPHPIGSFSQTSTTSPLTQRIDAAMKQALHGGTVGWLPAAKETTHTTPLFVRVDQSQRFAVAIAVDARTLTSLVVTADERADPWIVVDTQGTVILGRLSDAIGKHVRSAFSDIPTAQMDALSVQMAVQDSGSIELPEPHFWLGWHRVDTTPWRLFLPIDMRSIMGPVWDAVWRDAIIAILGLALNLTIVVLLTGWFTRPIRRLSAAFHTVESGTFDVRVPVGSNDEMGQMATGFNRMTEQLSTLVESVAADAASKAVFAREMGIASDMQASLIPSASQLPDTTVGRVQARMQPAFEVGGDFYDAWLKHESVWFTVADVSGKGVGAGLYMAFASTVLRGVRRHVDNPAHALRSLNDRLLEGDIDRPVFLTMFLGRLDPDGTVTYASAGHLPAIIFGKDNTRVVADATGPPIGMSTDVDWTTGTLHLEPGEHMLVYSDGAVEAKRGDGSMVEIEGLANMAEETFEQTDRDRIDHLVQVLTDLQTDGQFDDITVMSITRPEEAIENEH